MERATPSLQANSSMMELGHVASVHSKHESSIEGDKKSMRSVTSYSLRLEKQNLTMAERFQKGLLLKLQKEQKEQ